MLRALESDHAPAIPQGNPVFDITSVTHRERVTREVSVWYTSVWYIDSRVPEEKRKPEVTTLVSIGKPISPDDMAQRLQAQVDSYNKFRDLPAAIQKRLRSAYQNEEQRKWLPMPEQELFHEFLPYFQAASDESALVGKAKGKSVSHKYLDDDGSLSSA